MIHLLPVKILNCIIIIIIIVIVIIIPPVKYSRWSVIVSCWDLTS
jgi:hypothetical protein